MQSYMFSRYTVPRSDRSVVASPSAPVKVVLAGESGTGKTCLLARVVRGKFDKLYASTVGVDFDVVSVAVNGREAKLQVWDTAGQERFRSVVSVFFRNADCLVVVYDVARRETFRAVPKWIAEARKTARAGEPPCVLVLVGNKTDLPRLVATDEGRDLARAYGALFCETSALVGETAAEPFRRAAEAVFAKRAEAAMAHSADVYDAAVEHSNSPQRLGRALETTVGIFPSRCC